jgi:hypothetical protein
MLSVFVLLFLPLDKILFTLFLYLIFCKYVSFRWKYSLDYSILVTCKLAVQWSCIRKNADFSSLAVPEAFGVLLYIWCISMWIFNLFILLGMQWGFECVDKYISAFLENSQLLSLQILTLFHFISSS